MRLDKYLAERTGMTRSESRKAITKGRIMVDGEVVRKADAAVPETAALAVDGVPLAGSYQKNVYVMLNKPAGVVSASRDKKETTVVDLVAGSFPRRELFPAGRLDKTSTGFVLLTDDGALAHDILAPAHHVEKQYLVTLDTPLTEGGGNLSGGQRQRLALARALLHDSPVYIFDEATSNIDVESENDIMAGIHRLAGRKTVILISHRLANVTKADNIYVLDHGHPAGQGTHEALLAQGGLYADLWNRQQALENYGKEAQ